MNNGISPASAHGWRRQRFGSLEEHHMMLKAARPDLGWTSRQLAAGPFTGSVLARRTPRHAITCTTASGSFEMRGPVSTDHLTLSLSLHFPTPGLQWMRPIQAGMVGIYQPGEDCDAVNRGEVSFAVIDVSHAEVEWQAELEGVVMPRGKLDRSGVVPGCIPDHVVRRIRRIADIGHRGHMALPPGLRLDEMIMAAAIGQIAGVQRIDHAIPQGGYCRIVARARAWIEANLDTPIAIDDLVVAAVTSRRTLHRAFVEVLGETPQSYVLKMRLNRIRQELASPGEAERTVTTVSHSWGIPELGRLAARYREQFGELPRETLARRRLLN